MTGRLKIWECIGCGRIEAPQPCIGICQDRRVEVVYAAEHDKGVAQARAFGVLVRQLASTTPRDGEWERSYRALQQRARRVFEEFSDNGPALQDCVTGGADTMAS